jgi:hypothetical protein
MCYLFIQLNFEKERVYIEGLDFMIMFVNPIDQHDIMYLVILHI